MHLSIWNRFRRFFGFPAPEGTVVCLKIVFITVTGQRIERSYTTAEERTRALQEVRDIADTIPELKRWHYPAIIRTRNGEEIEAPWGIGTGDPEIGQPAFRHPCKRCSAWEWSGHRNLELVGCFSCERRVQIPT